MSNDDPIARFVRMRRRAREAGEAHGATAMTLATCSADGYPSARMVLLKAIDDRGAVFYTNFGSRKAAEIEENPRAALVFYWSRIDVQVRFEGSISRVAEVDADAYFATRPRQSQLGAWASHQSRTLPTRRELIGHYLRKKAEYLGNPVPRPPFWGGYRLAPQCIEFWLSRLGRLHDRVLYRRQPDGSWSHGLLYP